MRHRSAGRSRTLSLFVATAVLSFVTGAFESSCSAEPAPRLYVSLNYEVEGSAERCWDESEFRRRVGESVGYDPFRADAAVRVDVHVGMMGGLVDGRVEWQNAQGAGMGERGFRAKDGDCEKLLTEMSFAVGLQIELLRPPPGAEGGAGASATDAPTSATASAQSNAPSGAKPSKPALPQEQTASKTDGATSERDATGRAKSASARDFRLWVGIGPSLAFGTAPGLTGHGRLFLGARVSDVSLELGAEGTIEVTERQSDGSGFTQRLIGGSATACGHLGFGLGCAIGKASQLRISGLDVDQPLSPTALVAQAGLRLGAQWELSEVWFFTPHVDTLALLTPRTVTLNQVTVWDMPPLSVLVGIDVGGRFR
jgi:hypothetical protein